MSYRLDDEFDPGLEELIAEERAEKRRRIAIIAHPDCRDPDHPGCQLCSDEEDA